MSTQKLKFDCWCVGIHGRTGQEIDEGWLPAGTEIRNVRQVGRAHDGSPIIRFESVQGRSLYTQETFGEVHTEPLAAAR